jgi:DNA repair exonuclease SbcCD ATPase subunit
LGRRFALQIKYIRAKNFLSIGEPIEVDFTKYGNIVTIKGENRDQGPNASNGAGKSTLIEVIVYALFGELIKNLSHKKAINIKAKKGLEVEVRFDLDGHSYSIIRKREPNSIEIWKDGVNESKGGKDKQEEINKIIKLNYTAFINVVCFGQHNTKQFLACKAEDKRNIAENLLSLDKYNNYCKITKDKLKEFQTRLDNFSVLYEKSIQDIDTIGKQIKQIQCQQQEWKTTKLNGIDFLNKEIGKIQLRMSEMVDSSSADNYKKLQEVEIELAAKMADKVKKNEGFNFALEKMNKLKEDNQNNMLLIKELQYAVSRTKKEIDNIKIGNRDLISKDGGKCPVCYGIVDKSNFENILKHNEEHIRTLSEDLNVSNKNLEKYQEDYKKLESAISKIKSAYDDAKIRELDLNRTIKELERSKSILSASVRQNASSGLLLLEQQMEHMKDQLAETQKELELGDPYGDILNTIQVDLEKLLVKNSELKNDIKGIETIKPYYDFWVKAFGDKGIRSFIIDEIIPILNSRISYWLQFLVDNKIKLTFNKELEEKIERNPADGDPFVYNAMSGGEHQRIDLGIALAFAQVMMLTSGTCPSLVCLDEVGTNLDRPGIVAVYNMICELSREKQVLVTTHDPDLLEMLAGHETIKIIKENGFSRIEK